MSYFSNWLCIFMFCGPSFDLFHNLHLYRAAFFGFLSGCTFQVIPRDSSGMTQDLENYLLSSNADFIDSSEEYPPSFMNMW